ncbi:MAG: hypothetical protein G3M78_04955 [Candidatus Nitrohelix vancouverensis]|uniref:Lipoprotein SmpA/OmlA domain-containing protein n=1 Tax=Candidatus Nitrohelix vancouverensis TaxID=2705534 RepID=A0A7T0G310_9BACT|nr:MAG: hypothetical protein G3M78_04955 [Candidatus Nitrohelix vancouverensis]
MKRYLLSLLLVAAFLTACGTVGRDFDTLLVDKIQKNKTTQAEILDMFGIPFKEGRENGYEMWTYQKDTWNLIGKPESKGLVILFSEQNRVKAYRYTSTNDTP